jgi:hypothetical protein
MKKAVLVLIIALVVLFDTLVNAVKLYSALANHYRQEGAQALASSVGQEFQKFGHITYPAADGRRIILAPKAEEAKKK